MAKKSGPATWTVPRVWEGQDAYLIGGGPSVAKFDLTKVKGRNCIAINTSYKVAPWAQFLYFADHRWAAWWRHELVQLKKMICVTTATSHRFQFSVRYLKRDRENLLTRSQENLCGIDSGMHAVQLAYLLGAKRIFLIGYDMTFEKVSKKIEDEDEEKRVRDLQTPTPIPGKNTTQVIPDVEAISHHHKEHPVPSRLTNYERRFRPQYPVMRTTLAAKGVELLSLTPTSIPDMPVVDLDGVPCPTPSKKVKPPSPPPPRLVYRSRFKADVWHWDTKWSPPE